MKDRNATISTDVTIPTNVTTPTLGGSLDRRTFIRAAATTLVTTVASATAPLAAPAQPAATSGDPQIRVRRRLGRTNLEISDISYGSSRTTDPDIVRHALARGINYFDTAESYKSGGSEESLGVALAGHREEVILASKTGCKVSTRQVDLMSALEGSLRRLRTDRIDIYFNHAVNDIARLKNDEWYAFAETAKQQGKIRFTGISGHGGNLVECIDHAVSNDLVDVLLVAYNFGQDPAFYQRLIRNFDFVAPQVGLPEALDRARKKDIGVVAMKTLRGARLNDMRSFEYGGATTAQAAFRWTLHGGHVDALIVSMTSEEEIDEYVAASGGARPTAAELDWLDRYLASAPEGYCEHGCNVCESSCPAGVAISEVLRTRMYARDYADQTFARAEYAKLESNAAPCIGCSAPCTGACPVGIDIGHATRKTHGELA